MRPSEQLRQLPGYLAFNVGVIFLIALASSLMAAKAAVEPQHLGLIGLAILLAVLAVAAGFASMARIEFAKRAGKPFAALWIAPAALIALPLARAVAAGGFSPLDYIVPAVGLAAGLAGMAWLALRARQEVRA